MFGTSLVHFIAGGLLTAFTLMFWSFMFEADFNGRRRFYAFLLGLIQLLGVAVCWGLV